MVPLRIWRISIIWSVVLKRKKKMPSMIAHISNPRAQEAEAGGLHQVGDQPELDYTENSRPSRGTL